MLTVKENLTVIQEEIAQACRRGGRDAQQVNIVAVTKYVSEETTREALDAGIEHIGENRVEGAVEKWQSLGTRGTWHFIGSLQTRKVKTVIDKYDYFHSLDRLSLAKEFDKRATDGQVVRCFVQVNVSGEETKSGLSLEETIPFVESLQAYPALQVVGLMTMAPFSDDQEQTRPVFRNLKKLQAAVQAKNWKHAPCDELSMGMSNDFIVAVEEGATFVRIGSSLVGKEN